MATVSRTRERRRRTVITGPAQGRFPDGSRGRAGLPRPSGLLDSPTASRYHRPESCSSGSVTIAVRSEVSEIPNIASATKRLRQSEKRKGLNRSRKAALKRVLKQLRQHIDAGEKSEAVSLLPQLAKAADKASKRNAIHENRASRIKSRWAKKVQAL